MYSIYRYIYEVYKEQSFTRAAAKLFVSQPALSIAIKNHEDEIGIQIFDRSFFPIQLTEGGKVYLDGLQKILLIENELQTYLDDTRELRTGKITLGAPNLFASHLLPGFIAQFVEKYHDVEIVLKEMDFMSLQKGMIDGNIDLMIDSSEMDVDLFETIPLFHEHILLSVPASDPVNQSLTQCCYNWEDILYDRHLDEKLPSVSLDMFNNHRFLILEKGHDMRKRLLQACADQGFNPKIYMVLNQLVTAYNMVDRQIGLTFVSDTIVKLEGPKNRILFYQVDGMQFVRNINLILKKNRYIAKAMRAFIDIVLDISKNGLNQLIFK